MAQDKNWNEWFHQRRARNQAEQARKLEAEKQASHERGKEPFDLDRLDALYVRESHAAREVPREQRIAQLERDYYLHYRDVDTLEEFARALERSDRFDGGDLDRA